MTINADAPGRTLEFIADGVDTTFEFPFELTRPEEVEVFVDGFKVTSGYTVEIIPDVPGGTVTFLLPPVGGARIVIVDSPVISQERDYANQTGVWPNDIEYSLDKLTRITRRLSVEALRALKVPLDAVGADRNVTPGAEGTLPMWNAVGDLVPGPTVADVDASIDAVQAIKDATEADLNAVLAAKDTIEALLDSDLPVDFVGEYNAAVTAGSP